MTDYKKNKITLMVHYRRRQTVRNICLLIAVCCLVVGCGYTIQRKADLPFESIAIGKIENKTVEPKLQDKLSRALAGTFMEYGVQVNPSARYRVEGDITGFELRVLSEKELVATQYEVFTKANFRVIDIEEGRSASLMDTQGPFVTYLLATGKLDMVLAQKELATEQAIKSLSQELARRLIYVPQKWQRTTVK
jgi:hypothetical protein